MKLRARRLKTKDLLWACDTKGGPQRGHRITTKSSGSNTKGKGPVAHTRKLPQGTGPKHTEQAWSLQESGFCTAILGFYKRWR